MSQTPSNPNQPPQQGIPSFWGNMQPPQQWQGPQPTNQPFNPQFPSGQYPPVPQQGQFPQQGYPQQQSYPQQQGHLPQSYPQQQYQQPPMMPPPTPPKKKAWYKRPWGIVLIVFLSLGVCGGISSTFSSANGAKNTATDSVAQAATTVPTTVVHTTQPSAVPTHKPKPKPTATPAPTQSLTQIEASYKAKTTDTTVGDIDKQGDAYKGNHVHFTCKILNFVKDDSGTTAGANVDDPNDSTTSVVQITLPIGADLSQLNQGDSVEVWGDDGGTVSGTNAFGATIQEVVVVSLYMTDQTTGYQS